MVFKYFGTWIVVLNHFENLLIFEIFMILSMLNIVKVLCA